MTDTSIKESILADNQLEPHLNTSSGQIFDKDFIFEDQSYFNEESIIAKGISYNETHLTAESNNEIYQFKLEDEHLKSVTNLFQDNDLFKKETVDTPSLEEIKNLTFTNNVSSQSHLSNLIPHPETHVTFDDISSEHLKPATDAQESPYKIENQEHPVPTLDRQNFTLSIVNDEHQAPTLSFTPSIIPASQHGDIKDQQFENSSSNSSTTNFNKEENQHHTQNTSLARNSNNKPSTPHNEFLKKLKDPSCISFVTKIKVFVESFRSDKNRDETAISLHNFMSSIRDSLIQLEMFKMEDPDSLLDKLERFIIQKLFPILHSCLETSFQEDLDLTNKIKCLDWIEFNHLELSIVNDNITNLSAIQDLKKLFKMKCPRDKLVLILNCCRTIVTFLESENFYNQDYTSQHATADDILPMLIYVIIKSNPPNLQSQIEFIQTFRHPSLFVKEEAYFFTQFSSAVIFINGLGKCTHLQISDQDYYRLVLKSKEMHGIQGYELDFYDEEKGNNTRTERIPDPGNMTVAISKKEESHTQLLDLALSIETRYANVRDIEDLKISQLKDLFKEYEELVNLKNTVIKMHGR